MEILKPYRKRIDDLDTQIIDLLERRFGVVTEVGHLKAREGIAPVLQDRVDEVRERAGRLAAERGMDAAFIKHLYAQIIDHCCKLEENILAASRADARDQANSIKKGQP